MKLIPIVDQSMRYCPTGLGAQESQVPKNILVERLVLRPIAVEQQKGIDKQREVCREANVKCPVVFQYAPAHAKNFSKEELHLSKMVDGRQTMKRIVFICGFADQRRVT